MQTMWPFQDRVVEMVDASYCANSNEVRRYTAIMIIAFAILLGPALYCIMRSLRSRYKCEILQRLGSVPTVFECDHRPGFNVGQ